MAKVAFDRTDYYPFYDITTEDQADIVVDVPDTFIDEFQSVMMKCELLQSKVDDLANGITDDPHTENVEMCWCKPLVIRENNLPERVEHRR